MAIHRVLVIYKKTPFQIHIVERKDPRLRRLRRERHPFVLKMERADGEHRRTLEEVEKLLQKEGLHYRLLYRTEFTAEEGFDLIVTVGGDGTLLLASHHIRKKPVIAVSSARESVGFLCGTDRRRFPALLRKALDGKAPSTRLHRLRVRVGGRALSVPVLNEVLFTNPNPAATSRYRIRVRGKEEEHKSSGVYICTAAGSTAAVKSAGGRVLPLGSRKFQYVVREPYLEHDRRGRIQQGIVNPDRTVRLVSKMRHGKIYIDGPHFSWEVPFGETIEIGAGAPPLTVLGNLRGA